MRSLGRLAGWATLLALPCWALMGPYQKALGAVTAAALSVVGWDVEFTEVALMVPFDLAIYAALCLASANVSWRRRRRALLLGLPILVAGEVAGGILVVAVFMMTYRDPVALRAGTGITSRLLESIPWINAAIVWLVFLGADQLPAWDGLRSRGSPRT